MIIIKTASAHKVSKLTLHCVTTAPVTSDCKVRGGPANAPKLPEITLTVLELFERAKSTGMSPS
jgi:hypothetical protein